MNSIDYAKLMCDSTMAEYKAADLPYFQGRFHYIQGVLLLGFERVYHLCGDKRYMQYIRDWVDSTIDENGVPYIREEAVDDMMPALLLFDLYKETEDKKYLKLLNDTVGWFERWHRTSEGGFWHKGEASPGQMWLDGLFMASPFLARYAKEFNRPELFDDVFVQADLMKKHICDKKTGLYYHAWDELRQQPWADPETGCSAEFWGRALGWVTVALCDILDYFPKGEKREALILQLRELLEAVARYQDKKTGRWYQLVDMVDDPDNWLETSCSCLFAYSFHKAVRMGYIGEEYAEIAKRAYDGIMDIVTVEDGKVMIPEISVGTNVSRYDAYITRPRKVNDNHGTGTFLLMCCEYAAE